MKILVCVKQIPDIESKLKVNNAKKWINEEDLIFILNEYDLYAAEEAIRLKEKYPDSQLTVLTIGPSRAKDILIKVMGMGADEGIHILDEEEHLRDSYQKASIISQYCKDKGYDIIFFGLQSQDKGSGQVGPLTAGMLGYNCITGIVDFEYDNEKITAKKEIEGGGKIVLSTKPPIVVTCQSGLNQPRYVSLMNRRRAQKKKLEVISVEKLSIGESLIEVENLYAPERKSKGLMLEGKNEEIADELIDVLKNKAKVIK